MERIPIFIERGQKKTFCGALDWPGWCRFGKHDQSAMEKLLTCADRYKQVLERAGIAFQKPTDISDFKIVEEVVGDATTSFGAPSIILTADSQEMDKDAFMRSMKILEVSWKVFDEAVRSAQGKELRKGPRGGGRSLERILNHALEADRSYLARIAAGFKRNEDKALVDEILRLRQHMRLALLQAFEQGLPEKGPRGGKIWPLCFFFKRTIWHILDHAWEIEDRILE